VDTNDLNRLLSRLELAYYSAFVDTQDCELANQRLALCAHRTIALESIPRSLYDYAEAVANSATPIKTVERLREMFSPGWVSGCRP